MRGCGVTPTPKSEALRALEHVSKRLASSEPLDGLARAQLQATVEYAIAEVERIVAVQRIRKAKAMP
jgi:hypothetical protein